MRENTTRNAQPLDRAWTIRTDGIRVPAPRLELQSGSLNDLRSILCELAKNAKLEMKRGNKEAVFRNQTPRRCSTFATRTR